MTTIEAVHRALDGYLDALVVAGFMQSDRLGPPPPEAEVRSQLIDAGYVDRDDVVGWFTWRTYDRELSMFWEDSNLLPLADAIELRVSTRPQIVHYDWLEETQAFPGPAQWLPLLECDLREFLSVDAGSSDQAGRLYHLCSGEENEFVFVDLLEGLGAATFMIGSGQWQIDDGSITCERMTQPVTEDRDDPPWRDHSAAPMWSFTMPIVHADRLLFISAPGVEPANFAIPLETVLFSDAELAGAPEVAWLDATTDREQAWVTAEEQVANLEAGVSKLVRIAAGTVCGRIEAHYPSRYPRAQLLDPACTQRLLDAGFEAVVGPGPRRGHEWPVIDPSLSCSEVVERLSENSDGHH